MPEELPISPELVRILATTSVNAAPVPYWRATAEDAEGQPSALAQAFAGSTRAKTDADGVTRPHYICDNHAKVVARVDHYALAEPDADGLRPVHACAINGFLDTLKVLVERGGADPFAACRAGKADCRELAKRRGHASSVGAYLAQFEGDVGSGRLASVMAAVAARRVAEAAKRAVELAAAAAENDDSSSYASTMASPASVEARQQRAMKAAEARERALEASMKAIQTDVVANVELLPRVFWRAEFVVKDDSRGVGYYPRKPLADED